MMFFRRKHQKLDESSDEPPHLQRCEMSSSSESANSFDISNFNHESIAQSPRMENEISRTTKEHPSRDFPHGSRPRRFWILGWTLPRIDSSAKRRKKALAELDRTMMQIRGNSASAEAWPPHSTLLKTNHGANEIHELYKCDAISKVLPREVTWKRRVSSLEAFFKKECKSKQNYRGERFNESVIRKVVPFETMMGKSESSHVIRDEIDRPKYARPKPAKRNSTFEGTVEKGVSDILEKINSRSEEILDIVPDWSVASSSVDFISAATSDDETSLSGYRQIDSSWSPTHISASSGDDDEFFTSEGGCNSVESCASMTKDFETLLEEIMPRDFSMFTCYSVRNKKKKRRRKKLL